MTLEMFDLQRFSTDPGVGYANPNTSGNDENGTKRSITLKTGNYFALKQDATSPTKGKMSTYDGYETDTAAISSETDATYFFGVDGSLYEMSTTDDFNTALKAMGRNERETWNDNERFFLGTVTVTKGVVTGVTTFGGDNMWYGETVKILEGVPYTVKGDGYIYSIGAVDGTGTSSNAVIFELPGDGGYTYSNDKSFEFTVDSASSAITFTAEADSSFVRVLSGNMTVDLSDGAITPTNIVFMNGNDDAYNRKRGDSYTTGGWAARKDRKTDIAAIGMDSSNSTSVTFTGINEPKDVKVNNRSYTISDGIKFNRDYSDDLETASTSSIKSIEGTNKADTVVVGDSASTNAQNTDIAVVDGISLGDGDDSLTLGGAAELNVNGAVALGAGNDSLVFGNTKSVSLGSAVELGAGDDAVSFGKGAKLGEGVSITGGAGNDTYDLANNAAESTFTITDFATGDAVKNGESSVLTATGTTEVKATVTGKEVTKIENLGKDESVTVGDVVYTGVSATKIQKTVTQSEQTLTSYATITENGDVVGATYEGIAIEDVTTTAGTFYFEISEGVVAAETKSATAFEDGKSYLKVVSSKSTAEGSVDTFVITSGKYSGTTYTEDATIVASFPLATNGTVTMASDKKTATGILSGAVVNGKTITLAGDGTPAVDVIGAETGITGVTGLGEGETLKDYDCSYAVNGVTVALNSKDAKVDVIGAEIGITGVTGLGADETLSYSVTTDKYQVNGVDVASKLTAGTATITGATNGISDITLQSGGSVKFASTDTFTVNGKAVSTNAESVNIAYDGSNFTVSGLADGTEVTVENNKFTNSGTATLDIDATKGTLIAGTVIVNGTLATSVDGNLTSTGDFTATVSGGKVTSLTGLQINESVTLGNTTYTALGSNQFTATTGSTVTKYTMKSGKNMADVDLATDFSAMVDPAGTGSPTDWMFTDGTYDDLGINVTALGAGEAAFTVSGVAGDNVTVTVTRLVGKGILDFSKSATVSKTTVNMKTKNFTVVDNSGSSTVYTLQDGDTISVTGTFSSGATDGVITSATGVVNVLSGEVSSNATSAAYNLSTGATLTFNSGNALSSTAITPADGSTFKLSESGNTNPTIIQADGKVTGLDGDVTVTGAMDKQTFEVTGDGTVSINGVAFTVSDSGSALTYTVAKESKLQVSDISGVTAGTVISTTAVFADCTLTINGGTSVTGITSKDGISLAMLSNGAEITLNASGEAFTYGGFTYTLKTAGNSSSVVVNPVTGRVSGLKDGDQLVVTQNTAAYRSYAVSDGKLVITDDKAKTTASYSLPGGDESFWVDVKATAINTTGCTNGDPGKTLTDKTVTIGSETGTKDVTSVANGTMLDANGSVVTEESKATAVVNTTDDAITYTVKQTNREQDVTIKDTNNLDWNVNTSATTGGTNVTADNAGTAVKQSVNVSVGGGTSNVLVNSDADSNVTGGSGNLNAAVGGTGSHNVQAGSGKENRLTDNSSGETVLTGGSGKNTFTSTNENGKMVAGSGENTFNTATGKTTKVEGFTYGKDAVKSGKNITNTSDIKVGDGTISNGGKANDGEIDVSAGTGTGGFYAVTLKDAAGNKFNVGWNGSSGGNLDASSVKDDLVLIGDQNEDAADVMLGGSGDDDIYIGANDAASGGAGKNNLYLSTTNKGARTVGFGTAGARDNVTGFAAGFDAADADNLLLMGSASMLADDKNGVQLTMDSSNNATLKSGTSRMVLSSLAKNTSTNAVELLISGQKVASAADGTTINATDVNYADAYFGTGSVGLSFKNADGNVNVNLADTEHYRGIASVTGGTESSTLMGGTGKSTLVSAGGNTSLYGGTGNAYLVGAKDSRDEFFFFGESGNDTISGFEAGTGTTSDVLNLFGSSVTELKTTSAGLEISTSATSKVVLTGIKADSAVQWVSGGASGVAKIGSRTESNKFTYDKAVTTYLAGNKTDTISVSGSDNNEVWLDNVGGGIDVLDATSATGNNILAGNQEANYVKAGRGDDSLWGGAGSASDTIMGGSGADTFFYGYGEGDDVINSSKAIDNVRLYNVTVEDLAGAVIESSGITVEFKNGQTLTVNGSANEFTLGDGSTWVANRSDGSWSKKA